LMRLLGQIQGMDILMLVDSGSSNTFLSSELAARMTGAARLAKPLSVKVANGVSMS
jgi:predicted aspartyl protease